MLQAAQRQATRSEVRESEMAARLGGDEFALILVGTPGSAAAKIANTLIRSVLEAATLMNRMSKRRVVEEDWTYSDEGEIGFHNLGQGQPCRSIPFWAMPVSLVMAAGTGWKVRG